MKRAILATTALVVSSLMSSQALAVTTGNIPDQTQDASSTSTRDAACALVETALNGSAPSGVSYTVAANWGTQSSVYGSETAGDIRTEVPGSRQIAPGAQVLSFTNVDASGASHLSRNGLSPNIFATDAVAHTVTYDNSTYNFTGTFNITTTFNYSCDVTKHIAATAASSRPETFDECVQRIAQSDPQLVPGIYCKDPDHLQTVVVPGNPQQDLPDAEDSTTGSVDQAGTATGGDTELNGGPYTFQNQSLQVSAVVCISPGPKGGSWKGANLYPTLGGAGGACNTTTFMGLAPNTGIPSVSLPS